ncbi:MAG: serine/threonine-protein kinase, partial [Acidobacteriota bacterium]
DAEPRISEFLERPAGELVASGVGGSSRIDEDETRLGSAEEDAGAPTLTVGPTGELTDVAGKPDWEGPLGRYRLGGYRLVGLLGAGGMGQVYLGEDPRLGRQVAVKILPPEMAARGEWLERFEREARALATLNHPGIVTIHSIEEDDGIRFLTMERVEGRTLEEAIPDGGLPIGDFLRIALELADALGAAHRRGVVHRDLKPANVMVTTDRRVKILDFGIAKVEIAGRPNVSKEGQVLGTVAYMAPEQLLGDPVDARTDLFSFGILLYQMATGRHPFPGSTRIQRITLILDGKCRPVAEWRPDLPEAVSAVIARCVEKDPDDRYPDVEALATELSALRDALHAERFLETRTGWTPVTLPDRRASLRRWLGGLVAGLAIAVVLALVVGQRPDEVVPATESAPDVVVERAARTAVAVLEFQNLTGDPELDWLSAGIAELLITDLAQSPGLTLESLAEVRGAIDALGVEASDTRPEMLRQLADAVDADAIVRGSFARLGEQLRIAYTLSETTDDPSEDSTRASGSFEGEGEASLFALVDQLGAAIFDVYRAPPPELGAEPRSLAETTTSSLEAWQAFVRATALYGE